MVCSISRGKKKHWRSARFLQPKGTHEGNSLGACALVSKEFDFRPQPDFKSLLPPAHGRLNHYRMLRAIHS